MVEDNQSGSLPVSPEWLTIEQVAEWLQVSTKTIRRYVETGSLPAINLGGRAIRIRRQELEAWLQERRIEPGMSLRHHEHLEHRELRRQKHARGMHSPETASAEDLAEVNVTIIREDPFELKCNTCGATWTPQLRWRGRLAQGAWCCPNGCNCQETG